MAGRKISVVHLKALYYGEVITTAGLTGATLKPLLAGMTEVDVVHGETFKYEETAPTVTSYKNQLTGGIYRQSQEGGEVKLSFVLGQYDFDTKAALQGGTATATSWERPKNSEARYNCFVGLSKDGVYIVFPKGHCVANGADTDKAVGLAVSATAMDTGVVGLASEYWFDESEVVATKDGAPETQSEADPNEAPPKSAPKQATEPGKK